MRRILSERTPYLREMPSATSWNLRSEREVQMDMEGGWMRFPDGRRGRHILSELVDVNQGMCVP